MGICPTTSLRELAFIVCTALDRAGATAVLTGGGAATVYSAEAYRSRDLDFVLSFGGTRPAEPLTELGFTLDGSTYIHPNSPFTLDFPPGPLTIGSDVVTEWDTLDEDNRILHIIKPTDSVLDRFVAYVHWNELASLEIAAKVALGIGDRLDWQRIERWCDAEGASDLIEDLKSLVTRLRRR
ncbi:MAG: hypothetical protein IH944_09515 [Armatimonadetes bacterium]|nr:hypothetical protein [Armatimonadota bacterium]